MSPLLFIVLFFPVFIAAMACVRHVAAPKNKKYDPHYVRKLEIQELGAAVTQCSNEKCMECYPKVPARCSSGVPMDAELAQKKMGALSPNESRSVTPGSVMDQLAPKYDYVRH